jgi:succinate-acetate transporter protein
MLMWLILAFSSYGAFWISFALILLPDTGIVAAYKTTAELESALGIYLIVWFIITFLFLYVYLLDLFGSAGLLIKSIASFHFGRVLRSSPYSSVFSWRSFYSVLPHFAELTRKCLVFKGAAWISRLFCSVHTAGGAFGIVTALVAFYIGLSILLANEEKAICKLPLGVL